MYSSYRGKVQILIPIFDYLEQGILSDDEEAARKLVFVAEHFVIKDGTLYHIFSPTNQTLARGETHHSAVVCTKRFARGDIKSISR